MTTITKHKETETPEPVKEKLLPFIWQQGAAHILKDAKAMGLTEFDEGLDNYLEKGGYHKVNGGPAPLETWVSDSDQSPSRYVIIGRYDAYYGNITLVFQIQDRYGYDSFMAKYGHCAAILPEYMPGWNPVKPDPNNTRTAYLIKGDHGARMYI